VLWSVFTPVACNRGVISCNITFYSSINRRYAFAYSRKKTCVLERKVLETMEA
jgi:hypothetical protein